MVVKSVTTRWVGHTDRKWNEKPTWKR